MSALSTLALRGPLWVDARLHRLTLWTGVALLALAAAALPAARWYVDGLGADLTASGCKVEKIVPGCGIPVRHYLSVSLYFNRLFFLTSWLLTVLPVLLGAFVAGPVVGRELESGTYRLQWTQSVTPGRWLAGKVLLPAAGALLVLPASVLVQGWALSTTLHSWYPVEWYQNTVYPTVGPVAVAYALFAIAVGALAGLLLRRTVAGMAAAVGATAGTIIVLALLRPHLWPTADSAASSAHPWDLSTATASGVTDVRYHPEAHFWPLQLVEGGIVLILAAAATGAAFAVLRRRHA
ncbi:hypothetical protein [Streptomyces sp. NBC_01296]|uniref:hypothetical protein n=1 Tax=Streptomyces sp. NBC_01296 TaxID=2903816 RepID=UPI002E123D01|nr:hypothetical protein OG299_02785 [Streptomyces sp. NBC_01296]